MWLQVNQFNIFSECINTEEEFLVDLTDAINLNGVFALNEKVTMSCKKIFKSKIQLEEDKLNYLESNLNDPELIIYIPFKTSVKIKSFTMVGGEDGTSPSNLKVFVNKENPDFDLIDSTKATQVIKIIYLLGVWYNWKCWWWV